MTVKIGNVTAPRDSVAATPELSREIDSALLTLPIDVLTLTVRAFDGCPDIKQGLPVHVSGDAVNGTDVLFVKSARKTGADSYSLTCYSWLGKLAHMEYGGNIYLSPAPLTDVVADIMRGSGVPYSVDSTLAVKNVSGYIPEGNKREALQQVLFAVSGLIKSNGDNGIILTAQKNTGIRIVTEDEICAFPRIKYSDSAKSITLSVHKYIKAWPQSSDAYVTVKNKTYIVSTDTLTLYDIRSSKIEDYTQKRIKKASMVTYDNFADILERTGAAIFNDDKYEAEAIFDSELNVGDIATFPVFEGETFTGRIEEKSTILGALNKCSISVSRVVESSHIALTLNYVNSSGEIVHTEALHFPVPCRYEFAKSTVTNENNSYISVYVPEGEIYGIASTESVSAVPVRLTAQFGKNNKTLTILEASSAEQSDDGLVIMG